MFENLRALIGRLVRFADVRYVDVRSVVGRVFNSRRSVPQSPTAVWLGVCGNVFAGIVLLAGCQTEPEQVKFVKPPRPVTVMVLSRTQQLQKQLVTGTIAPWKTEEIGFEVGGRVSFVIEQNEEVQPELPASLDSPATVMAKLVPEQFEIAVETAEADYQVAQRRLDANRVAIEKRLPALIQSAVSELEFSQAEFRRVAGLKDQSAISATEFDSVKNRLRVAKARLSAAEAELSQAEAEQATLSAQVRRADQSVQEAKRNLRNTTLHSSFRGIVSKVHLAPGSFVQAGDPVVTVQMMDPMLVEFEVSPNDSRKYAKGDILNVLVTGQDGVRRLTHGMVYTVDAVADSNSRTYTVTLHIRNEKEPLTRGTSFEMDLPRVRRIFSLDVGPVITGGSLPLVEKSCLHKIGDQTVIWKIVNRKANQTSNPSERILEVRPIQVTCGKTEIPLLGQWSFFPVEFKNPDEVDIKNDLITDQLIFPSTDSKANSTGVADLDPWAPRKVLLQQDRWSLRTGDVVQVLRSEGDSIDGFFVPMKAIQNSDGKTFVHVIDATDTESPVARRINVVLQSKGILSGDAIVVQIRPQVAGALSDGTNLVIGGSHYLTEGARVRVVGKGGPSR